MTSEEPFRQQVRFEFERAFGEPQVLNVERGGEIYRWVLVRKHGLDLFVTLDSPELPEIAHIIISDPLAGHNVAPVLSITMRTIDETKRVVEQIREQWKRSTNP